MLQENREMWEAFRDLPLKPDEKKTIHEQFEARRGASLGKISQEWQQIPAQGVEARANNWDWTKDGGAAGDQRTGRQR